MIREKKNYCKRLKKSITLRFKSYQQGKEQEKSMENQNELPSKRSGYKWTNANNHNWILINKLMQ